MKAAFVLLDLLLTCIRQLKEEKVMYGLNSFSLYRPVEHCSKMSHFCSQRIPVCSVSF